MAIGDKYYRKYLTLTRRGVNQQDIAVASQSSTDDGCGASTNSGASFGTWKSHLQERYVSKPTVWIRAASLYFSV